MLSDLAENLEVQVMDKRKKVLGAEHPHTLYSMTNIARTYKDQGRWNDAKKIWLEVVNIKKRIGRI